MKKQEEMMQHKTPYLFEIQLVSDKLVAVSEVISKARVKIFYKGKNRNGGFITDSFAEQLIKTLPYTPIKGILDVESGDFQGHGFESSEGKIYGIVPQEPNIAWEKSLDIDGIERDYLTADIYLFTGLYESAKHILGKGQSMELLPSSINGTWVEMDDNIEYFVYDSACFLGLQVLGKKHEPAFEGASFFSLKPTELSHLLKEIYGGENLDTEKDLNQEKAEVDISAYEAQIEELTADNKTLSEQVQELQAFKLNVERAEKEAILAEFSALLGEEESNKFREDFDKMDKLTLEKELVFRQYQLEKEKSVSVVEEKTVVEENQKSEGEKEVENTDKSKEEFSFYEVENNDTKSDIEVLLDKYL